MNDIPINPPIDNTNIIVNGQHIDKSSIQPIVSNKTPIIPYKNGYTIPHRKKNPISVSLEDSINKNINNDDKVVIQPLYNNDRNISKQNILNILNHNDNPFIPPFLQPGSIFPEKKKKVIKKKIVKKKKVKINVDRPIYDSLSEHEKTIYRTNFKLKLDLLRKWYPSLNIPKDIENHENLNVIHDVYELYLNHVYKESTSNFYRGVLLLSWLGLELFGTFILGLDAAGYVKEQISMMWIYEPIIEQFSKINFTSIGEGWSPFQQLIMLVILTFVGMIVVKLILNYISNRTGTNVNGLTPLVLEYISKFVVGKPQESKSPQVLINNTPVNLTGIHNVNIPEPSTLNSSDQIKLTTNVLNIIDGLTGKETSQKDQTVAPSQVKPKSKFKGPTYSG